MVYKALSRPHPTVPIAMSVLYSAELHAEHDLSAFISAHFMTSFSFPMLADMWQYQVSFTTTRLPPRDLRCKKRECTSGHDRRVRPTRAFNMVALLQCFDFCSKATFQVPYSPTSRIRRSHHPRRSLREPTDTEESARPSSLVGSWPRRKTAMLMW